MQIWRCLFVEQDRDSTTQVTRAFFYTLVESARICQKYTCRATSATKVSFYHGSAGRVWKSEQVRCAGSNKRLYHLRYPRLLISPRNPNVFFLTICTPPSSSGSCAIPRYPENKQVVPVCIPQIRHVHCSKYINFLHSVREFLSKIHARMG